MQIKQGLGIVSVGLGAAIAHGEAAMQTLEHPFEGTGSFVDLAEWTTLVIALLILVIVLVTMIFGRRRVAHPQVQFLRFVGLCALPIFMLMVGTFANLEGSKRVSFCESCHSAMALYVDDMRAVDSDTLAAVHYQNRYIQEEQCYSCHADYGVHGAIGAKARGLVHLYYWVTQSPTAQGVEQIHHYGPFKNELCFPCHAGSQAFLKIDDHLDFQEDMLTKDPDSGAPDMSCLDCHGPAHKPLKGEATAQKG